ncbi:hypothetical protein BC938DRAFT_474674 [Jimgerdemannia flammicorona]|uniref:NmrA-like domain-containing protein n=1 Tax=Jimgerdemannia flammicorona TaxID=994334 RepID=A0A433QSA4_9FUNG|nr:hypothetical protein BC938DRAFT_474674 [Jimgerdemannia flammicorona]
MAQFKTVLVAGGFGRLGKFIIDEFVANGTYNVKILSRPSSLTERISVIEKYKAVGVEVVAVEYTDHAGLVKILKGVDVVVSTVSIEAVYDEQIVLIKASVEAGVKRFIPSDFGSDHERVKHPFIVPKVRIAEHLRAHKTLEHTIFYTNYWTDTTLQFAGWDLDAHKAIVIGDGNDKFTLTHRRDIAKFVVASLKNPKARNAVHGTASEVVTWNEIIRSAEKHSGHKFEVTYRSLSEVEEQLKITKESAFETARDELFSLPPRGQGVIVENVKEEYPEIKTITIDEYLREYYANKP